MIVVQFSDSTEATVIGYFASPQNTTEWPNLGSVEASDPRWKAYFELQSAEAQRNLPQPD